MDKNSFAKIAKVYSALWKDSTLHYDNNKNEYIRIPNIKVALIYIYGLQNIIGEFNKVWNFINLN